MPDSDLYIALIQAGCTVVTGVPDSGLRGFIRQLEQENQKKIRYLPAAREDAAVGLAAGAALGGDRVLVFMESSGIGTSLDSLTSLAMVYRLPIVLLVVWAGYAGRDLPHHNAIGVGLEDALTALGLHTIALPAFTPREATHQKISEAFGLALQLCHPVVVLMVPRELEAQHHAP